MTLSFLVPSSLRYRCDLVEEFIKQLINMKKCNNCGMPSQTLRKDGCRKIFVRPLSARAFKTNASRVGHFDNHKSAIEKLQEVEAGRGNYYYESLGACRICDA